MDIYRKITRQIDKIQMFRHRELMLMVRALELYPNQLPILEYIKNNDGCMQADISRDLGVTPASIALSVKRLQKAGMLIKEIDENNLRKNRLSLTDKGRESSRKSRRIFDEFDRKMYKDFTEEELNILAEFNARIGRNVIGKDIESVSFEDLCGNMDGRHGHRHFDDDDIE